MAGRAVGSVATSVAGGEGEFERFKSAPDALQRRAWLTGFLKRPQLYGQLLEKYSSGLPSDADLRVGLVQRGFNAAAAEGALTTFRRSVAFVDMPVDKAAVRANAASVAAPSRLENRPGVVAILPSELPVVHSPIASADENSDRIPIRLPGNRRAWLNIPTPFFKADKSRLKAQIDLLLMHDEEYGL